MILLCLRSVLTQELRRTERVRYHNGDARRDAARRNFLKHHAVRVRGETFSTVLGRYAETKKTFLSNVRPHLRRQILIEQNLIVVDHFAEGLALVGVELSLLRSEPVLIRSLQLVKRRTAGEYVSIETDLKMSKRARMTNV